MRFLFDSIFLNYTLWNKIWKTFIGGISIFFKVATCSMCLKREIVMEIGTDLSVSLLGLLAKIMCSICSFQLNIWNVVHRTTCILNWFLNSGHGIGACSVLATGWPGLALPPGFGPLPFGENILMKKQETELNLIICYTLCYLKPILS